MKMPVSSLAAPAAIAIFCTFLALSISHFPPGFTPVGHWMSDLGNTNLNPEGAAAFNAGCMIAGVPAIAFFLGFYRWYTHELWRNLLIAGAQIAGAVSGLSLIMVGQYPELFASEHYAWSAAFFVSMLVALLLANAALFTHRRYDKYAAAIGLIAISIMVVFVAAELAAVRYPIFEWLSVTVAMTWSIAMALDMYVTFK